jgi:hypothetical protein
MRLNLHGLVANGLNKSPAHEWGIPPRPDLEGNWIYLHDESVALTVGPNPGAAIVTPLNCHHHCTSSTLEIVGFAA